VEEEDNYDDDEEDNFDDEEFDKASPVTLPKEPE